MAAAHSVWVSEGLRDVLQLVFQCLYIGSNAGDNGLACANRRMSWNWRRHMRGVLYEMYVRLMNQPVLTRLAVADIIDPLQLTPSPIGSGRNGNPRML